MERKQQDPIVLTKWRHSTYVLDLNDKVSLREVWELTCVVRVGTQLLLFLQPFGLSFRCLSEN